MSKRLLVLLLLASSSQAFSEGSPWLPADGTTTVGFSVTSGGSNDFFIGDTSTDLGGELEGTVIWLNASYGYDDIWAIDAKTGYARSEFEFNPDDQSDITDTSFGVSYQILNEFEADNGLPTIAGRIGYTFGGDYETDLIDAIGDGASGFDLSLLVGKTLTPVFAISGDITYRQRDGGVADGFRILASGNYLSPIAGLGFQLAYGLIRTDSDININEGDFGVEQFSQTDRDSDWLIAGANYSFENGIGLGLTISSILDGRNIPDTDTATFSFGYSF